MKERIDMKNYVEPKMDVEVIENDIITFSYVLPPVGGKDDDILG